MFQGCYVVLLQELFTPVLPFLLLLSVFHFPHPQTVDFDYDLRDLMPGASVTITKTLALASTAPANIDVTINAHSAYVLRPIKVGSLSLLIVFNGGMIIT